MQNTNQYVGRKVVLVDSNDNKLGLADIWEAHKNPGLLHRAISVVLWRKTNNSKEILLQKRSAKKPLWPLFWSNTVCTHPFDEEGYLECGVRRLKEELGIKIDKSQLKILFRMQYQADYSPDLSENELDTVIIGEYMGDHLCNPDEAEDAKWVAVTELRPDILANPGNYTPWFKLLLGSDQFKQL